MLNTMRKYLLAIALVAVCGNVTAQKLVLSVEDEALLNEDPATYITNAWSGALRSSLSEREAKQFCHLAHKSRCFALTQTARVAYPAFAAEAEQEELTPMLKAPVPVVDNKDPLDDTAEDLGETLGRNLTIYLTEQDCRDLHALAQQCGLSCLKDAAAFAIKRAKPVRDDRSKLLSYSMSALNQASAKSTVSASVKSSIAGADHRVLVKDVKRPSRCAQVMNMGYAAGQTAWNVTKQSAYLGWALARWTGRTLNSTAKYIIPAALLFRWYLPIITKTIAQADPNLSPAAMPVYLALALGVPLWMAVKWYGWTKPAVA